MRSSRTALWKQALFSAMLVAIPSAAAGQADQGGSRPDFLFGRPSGTVGFKAAFLVPREQGDLFSFVRENLTIDKGDFRTPAMGVVLGINLTSRVTATFDYEFSKASIASESRAYIGSDGLPIAQRTTLSTHNFSVGLKLALLPTGRPISRFAWIRRGVVPYVGAGFGGVNYEFDQQGEFVDFESLDIFDHHFLSSEWGPAAHAFGGVDLAFARNASVTLEGRYVWAEAAVGPEFTGFDGIDLAGFRLATGLNLAF